MLCPSAELIAFAVHRRWFNPNPLVPARFTRSPQPTPPPWFPRDSLTPPNRLPPWFPRDTFTPPNRLPPCSCISLGVRGGPFGRSVGSLGATYVLMTQL